MTIKGMELFQVEKHTGKTHNDIPLDLYQSGIKFKWKEVWAGLIVKVLAFFEQRVIP